MDPKDIRTLKILQEIEREKPPSQRDLAKELNISLGLVNSFIKRLAKMGYMKITSIPKNRIKYILTPKGAAEKTRLTYKYIQHSYQFYKEARAKLRCLFLELEAQSIHWIIFYGAGDLAEIAYVSLQETDLRLSAVVDDLQIGKKFMKFTVADPDSLETLVFDKILITSIDSRDRIRARIMAMGISLENVVEIQ